MTRLAGLALALAVLALASGLDRVRSEPNAEKRSRLALEYANAEVNEAAKAYTAGDVKLSAAAIHEVRDSVDLCQSSLKATRKDARKSPKPFKHAEMEIRELLRRLKSLETDFSVDDRGAIIDCEQHLLEVHDDLIQQIMTKKKK